MTFQVMPDLSADEYTQLKADIAARGVLVPVEYDDAGNVLDGHHRLKACEELGITAWPKIVRHGLSEEAKRLHARQLNLARRHLNQEQRRALIAEQLRETPEKSNNSIAAGLGVDHKTVGVVREQLKARWEIPNVSERIDTLGRKQPATRPTRSVFVDDTPEGKRAALDRAKEVRAETAATSTQLRLDRIAEIARGNVELPTSKRYPVIYADPPWRYENPPMGGGNRSIENHYPTMDLAEICALPVAGLATDDAILYLWATAPKLAECFEVIKAWGFQYRTNFVWVKDKIGMGYHARSQHELLLVAKRGNLPPPPVEVRVSSVIAAPRSEHSEKPDRVYELIERFYPQLPKIELFSRWPRDGWAAWGNQAGEGRAA